MESPPRLDSGIGFGGRVKKPQVPLPVPPGQLPLRGRKRRLGRLALVSKAAIFDKLV